MEKHASTQETVRGQNVFEWYEALISAALVLVLVFSLFFRIIQVDGESMVPTLQNGDKLIVWGAGYEPQTISLSPFCRVGTMDSPST